MHVCIKFAFLSFLALLVVSPVVQVFNGAVAACADDTPLIDGESEATEDGLVHFSGGVEDDSVKGHGPGPANSFMETDERRHMREPSNSDDGISDTRKHEASAAFYVEAIRLAYGPKVKNFREIWTALSTSIRLSVAAHAGRVDSFLWVATVAQPLRLDMALMLYNRAAQLFSELDSPWSEAQCYNTMAKLYGSNAMLDVRNAIGSNEAAISAARIATLKATSDQERVGYGALKMSCEKDIERLVLLLSE